MSKKNPPKLNSTAVMARRHKAPDTLDFFPTPAWATRALTEFLIAEGHDLASASVLEPAAGRGHMAAVLDESFGSVKASDIHDWPADLGSAWPGMSLDIADFTDASYPVVPGQYDWIITNPPFVKCADFSTKAFDMCGKGSAMLLRGAYLETVGRYNDIFSVCPPNLALVFSERLGMMRDDVDKKTGSATMHAWFVWTRDDSGNRVPGRCQVDWFAPGTRKRHERDSDYDFRIDASTQTAPAPLLLADDD